MYITRPNSFLRPFTLGMKNKVTLAFVPLVAATSISLISIPASRTHAQDDLASLPPVTPPLPALLLCLCLPLLCAVAPAHLAPTQRPLLRCTSPAPLLHASTTSFATTCWLSCLDLRCILLSPAWPPLLQLASSHAGPWSGIGDPPGLGMGETSPQKKLARPGPGEEVGDQGQSRSCSTRPDLPRCHTYSLLSVSRTPDISPKTRCPPSLPETEGGSMG